MADNNTLISDSQCIDSNKSLVFKIFITVVEENN
jgi:hypothetical protein